MNRRPGVILTTDKLRQTLGLGPPDPREPELDRESARQLCYDLGHELEGVPVHSRDPDRYNSADVHRWLVEKARMTRGIIMNSDEICDMIDVSQQQLREYRRRGMPVYKQGKSGVAYMYNSADVFNWMLERAREKAMA